MPRYLFAMQKIIGEKVNWLCFLLFVILSSCTKEVDITLPDIESKLVVTSLLTADSLLTVHISKSVSITDTANLIVENATAILYINGTLQEVLDYDSNGFYVSKSIVQKKENYEIKVTAPSFQQVQSTAQIPEQVKLIATNFTQNAGIDEEGYEFSTVSIQFRDQESTQDFYEIQFYEEHLGYKDEKFVYGFGGFSYDPIIKAEGDQEYYPDYLLLSDELINGETVNLDINFFDRSSSDRTLKIYLEFRAVSRDYYLYKKSLIRHLANQFPDIWDGTGEPAQLFTNIENGYGIFAGYTVDGDTVYKSN